MIEFFSRRWRFYTAAATLALASCNNVSTQEMVTKSLPRESTVPPAVAAPAPAEPVEAAAPLINLEADAATILARPQVPILCYHQIRDWRASDSKGAKDYIVPTERFQEHLQMLADSGFHTILPDQLLAYLTTGAPLPDKPVMLTFDDTNLDQYTVAAPELEKHGFKGVFFVMTVSLGRPRYMSRAQVRELAERGHVIGCHTWDHQNIKKLQEGDWLTQVEKPKQVLEEVTGQPVTYFAYPFGLWNQEVIPELKSRGITAAFQLAKSQDAEAPLFTIRRNIASGYWGAQTLHRKMVQSYHLDEKPAASPDLVASGASPAASEAGAGK